MKTLVDTFCAYCGTNEKEVIYTFRHTRIKKHLRKDLMIIKKNNELYYNLKMCPACETIIDIIKIQ